MRRYVGLLGGLHVGGRVHKRVLLVTEVSLGRAVIRIALGVGSGDGVRDEVAHGCVRDSFENIIKEQEEKTDTVFSSVKVDGGRKIGMRARLDSCKHRTSARRSACRGLPAID